MSLPPGRRRVVFVCAGNICRSPVALHAFRRALARHSIDGVETASFGLVADDGDVPCAETLRAASDAGLDLGSHVARRLEPDLLRRDDLILVMELAQRDAVHALASPEAVVVVLGSLQPTEPVDISDPEGGDEEVFDACASRIVACVEVLASSGGFRPSGT